MPIDKISFRASAPQVQNFGEKPAEVATEEQPIDEEKSNATKYMVGATALAGVVALGIAGYKGHLGKGIQKFLGGAERASTKAETPVTPVTNVTPTTSVIPEDLANSIKKTKQKLVDGEPFYGVAETKNAQLFYENGFITQSKLSNGTFKRYDRDIDGNLKYFYVKKPKEYTLTYYKKEDGSILIEKHLALENPEFKFTSGKEHEGSITIETKISPDGEISKTKIENFNTSHPNYKKGKEVPLCREIDLSTGKSKTYDRTKSLRFMSSYSAKTHKIIDGKNVTIIRLSNNKFESAYHSVYNPKTNIITKQFYAMEDGKLVPTNRFEQIDKKTGYAIYYDVDEAGKKVLKTLDLNNTIPKKGRYYNGDYCYSVSDYYHITESDLLEKIKEKGLNFEL